MAQTSGMAPSLSDNVKKTTVVKGGKGTRRGLLLLLLLGLPASAVAQDVVANSVRVGPGAPYGHGKMTVDHADTTQPPDGRRFIFECFLQAQAVDGDPSDMYVCGHDTVYVGANGVDVQGSALGRSSNVVILRDGGADSEYAAYHGIVAYWEGDGYPNPSPDTAKSRAWFADFNLQGPINRQNTSFSGLTMLVNKYDSRPPIARPSAALEIVTLQNAGAGKDDAHALATTYPIDSGLAIGGYSSPAGHATYGPGFRYGINVGAATNWNDAGYSLFDTGIRIAFFQQRGLYITDPLNGATAIDSTGPVFFRSLPGGASGKRVLCIDATTGRLSVSGGGTDCRN